MAGGWGGIRTHGTLTRTAVFKTAAFNRSATHPKSQQTKTLNAARQALMDVRAPCLLPVTPHFLVP
jgi:hypothetical protein